MDTLASTPRINGSNGQNSNGSEAIQGPSTPMIVPQPTVNARASSSSISPPSSESGRLTTVTNPPSLNTAPSSTASTSTTTTSSTTTTATATNTGNADATSSAPQQIHPQPKTRQSTHTNASIDFAKISRDIRQVSEKVKQINVELRDILKELEGFSSDDPNVQARLRSLQGKVLDAAELTVDVQGLLDECKNESQALRPLVFQDRPAKTHADVNDSKKRSKNQSELEKSDNGSRSRGFPKPLWFGKTEKNAPETEDEGDASEELVERKKPHGEKTESKSSTPVVEKMFDDD